MNDQMVSISRNQIVAHLQFESREDEVPDDLAHCLYKSQSPSENPEKGKRCSVQL